MSVQASKADTRLVRDGQGWRGAQTIWWRVEPLVRRSAVNSAKIRRDAMTRQIRFNAFDDPDADRRDPSGVEICFFLGFKML
jgi:hypothetical protein